MSFDACVALPACSPTTDLDRGASIYFTDATCTGRSAAGKQQRKKKHLKTHRKKLYFLMTPGAFSLEFNPTSSSTSFFKKKNL